MQNNINVLVTGASGFVGSHLARKLVSLGYKVHILVRAESDLTILGEELKSISVHIYNDSINEMIDIINVSSPEIVVHLASYVLGEHSPNDVPELLNSNITLGANLVEAMNVSGIKKFINTGTYWQHFNDEEYNPVCLYAAMKESFEKLLEYYIQACSFNVVTLELFDTYGPLDNRNKLFSLLLSKLSDHKQLEMSEGEQYLDLVYIDDVVDAYLVAIDMLMHDTSISHHKYSVSSGTLYKLKEIVTIFEDVAGYKLPINWGGRPYRNREVMKPWSKGENLPNWKCKTDLVSGIKNIISG